MRIKERTKWILTFLSLIALSVAMCTAFVKINGSQKTKDIGFTAYSIATIDDAGEVKESTTTICTKQMIDAKGLTCKVNDDAKINYAVYFYDADGAFVSKTTLGNSDFEATSVPSGVTYARILIVPTDVKLSENLSVFDVRNYAKMLTVTVNK